jgi:hypothetical protein
MKSGDRRRSPPRWLGAPGAGGGCFPPGARRSGFFAPGALAGSGVGFGPYRREPPRTGMALPGRGGGRGLARGGGAWLELTGLDPPDQFGEPGEKRGEQGQEQRADDPRQPVAGGLFLQIPEDLAEAFGDAGG